MYLLQNYTYLFLIHLVDSNLYFLQRIGVKLLRQQTQSTLKTETIAIL